MSTLTESWPMQLEVTTDGRRYVASVSFLMHNLVGRGRCDGTGDAQKWEAVARCFADAARQISERWK